MGFSAHPPSLAVLALFSGLLFTWICCDLESFINTVNQVLYVFKVIDIFLYALKSSA
jgi:hypothetical protein